LRWLQRKLLAGEPPLIPRKRKNGLVEGWHYYVKEDLVPLPSDGTSDNAPVKLQLFVDSSCIQYPVTFRRENDGEADQESVTPPRKQRMRGRLEVDRGSSISWTLAFVLALLCIGILVGFVGFLISLGLVNFRDNLKYFETGIKEAAQYFIDAAKRILPAEAYETFQTKVQEYVSQALPGLLSAITSEFQSFAWQGILFLLYLGFWLSEPLPVKEEVSDLFKSYIMLKTLVCVLFGCLMGLLLMALDNPLWPLMICLTSLLNFIPEVGAVLSALLCLPAVLLDGHVDMAQRLHNTVMLVIFGSLFKVITGNIIEVRLYASTGGQFMRMHPVVLMVIMMLCAALLGLTGMFLSIPIMATIKYYLLTARIPAELIDPVLLVIEGEESGPYKNFMDSARAEEISANKRHRERARSVAVHAAGTQLSDLNERGNQPLLAIDRSST